MLKSQQMWARLNAAEKIIMRRQRVNEKNLVHESRPYIKGGAVVIVRRNEYAYEPTETEKEAAFDVA